MPGTIPEFPQQTAAVPPDKVTIDRLEDQIVWYSAKSRLNQRRFKLLKAVTIISAAVIPVFTTSGVMYGSQIAAGLGVLIVIVEGLQQMNQYQANWTSYRLTGEALKHEKYLYFGKAGPYTGAASPGGLLAERVESLISQEESKWITTQSPRSKP
jgi:hypothetical protein